MNKQPPTPRYIRRPEYDRRIGRGDDFAGDAWEDTSRTVIGDSWRAQTIVYTIVGFDPNRQWAAANADLHKRGNAE